jgi:hypothetical protein
MYRLVISLILLATLVACGGEQNTRIDDATPEEATPAPSATVPAPPQPATPTFVPTTATGQSTRIPPVPTGRIPTLTVPAQRTSTIRLGDAAWTGGWRNRGESIYGGRTATWIYGAGTQWSTMQASFDVPAPVRGTAHLMVEGMDDEIGAKIKIEISVNGTPIFTGANPLPNDDMPLDSGTWATQDFPFDAALLVVGENRVSIYARTPGNVGRPPFFMLDYAEIVLDHE